MNSFRHAHAATQFPERFAARLREGTVMMPLVADLSDRDMRDLAPYYAYLPRPRGADPAAAAATAPRRCATSPGR